jgi:outer membrane protein OmpA-like peptidoglycan-associated protein
VEEGSRMSIRASGVALAVLLAMVVTGCAKRARVGAPPPMTRVDALSGPHFAYDRDDLTPAGRAKVREVAAMLNKYPHRRVDVSGYTDSMGSDEHNLRLSERRTETVKRALIEDGVAPNRIITRAYGESNPVASNATAEGRAQNRRVEIVLE